MLRLFCHYIVRFALATALLFGTNTPVVAQNISVRQYHRGLKDLNRQIAIIKEQLRQEKKERKRLEYELSKNPKGSKGTVAVGDDTLTTLLKDRDTLFEKVASLETRSSGLRLGLNQFSLSGTLKLTKLTREEGGSSSHSAVMPLYLGINHRFNDASHLDILLKAGPSTLGSALIAERAVVTFNLQHGLSLWAGRASLPLTSLAESHRGVPAYSAPREFLTVAEPLFHSTLAPFGLTGDGVGLSYAEHKGNIQKAGVHAALMIHSGLEADFLDGREGLARSASVESRSFEKLGATLRVGYRSEGYFRAGLSATYTGLARSVSQSQLAGSPAGAALTGVLADGRMNLAGLHLDGGIGHYEIAESDRINALYGRAVGKTMSGFYFSGAFDLLKLGFESQKKLMVFLRYDDVNTQQSTEGFEANKTFHRKQTTFGLNYEISKQLVFKVDNVILNDDARGTKDDNLTRIGIGFAF